MWSMAYKFSVVGRAGSELVAQPRLCGRWPTSWGPRTRGVPSRSDVRPRCLDDVVPVRHLAPVPDQPPAIAFAEVVRAVSAVARHRGLQIPVFRSPPRLADVDRTMRRRTDGQAVIAIRLTDRPFAAVQADVIAGVVAVNELDGAEAGRFRRAAWSSIGGGAPIDLRRSVSTTASTGTAAPSHGVTTPKIGVA